MQKTYTFITTPSHGYLSVSIKEIKRLKLVDKIGSGSYMNLTRVYLEEDCDASLFLEAKKKLNEKIDIKSSYREVKNILPGGFYDAYNVNNPIKVGSIVENGNRVYKVIKINKSGIVVQNDGLYSFIVTANNPYRYLKVKNENEI